MNIQISLKFRAVCAASKVLQNYNDLGLKEIHIYIRIHVCTTANINPIFLTVLYFNDLETHQNLTSLNFGE